MTDTENKRWRVEMADKTTRTIEARGFRVECGALVLVHPAGCAAAYPPTSLPWSHFCAQPRPRHNLNTDPGLAARINDRP